MKPVSCQPRSSAKISTMFGRWAAGAPDAAAGNMPSSRPSQHDPSGILNFIIAVSSGASLAGICNGVAKFARIRKNLGDSEFSRIQLRVTNSVTGAGIITGMGIVLQSPPRVLNAYSLAVSGVAALGSAGGFSGAAFWRVETPAGTFCLRRWPSEHPSPERLRTIHDVLRHVFDAGVTQVPVPLRTRDGGTFVCDGGCLWELAPWMPGTADYHSRSTRERLAAAMRLLARFHKAAATYPGGLTEKQTSPGEPRGVSPGVNRYPGGLTEKQTSPGEPRGVSPGVNRYPGGLTEKQTSPGEPRGVSPGVNRYPGGLTEKQTSPGLQQRLALIDRLLAGEVRQIAAAVQRDTNTARKTRATPGCCKRFRNWHQESVPIWRWP
jgi:hypothetical protein